MIPGLSQLGPRRRSSRQSQQEQVQQQLHPDDHRSRRHHYHHHTHHHHHYHNRPRAGTRFQQDVGDPSSQGPSTSATDIASSSRPAQEPYAEDDRLFRARLPSFISRRPEYQRPEARRPESDARRVALEARGRLDERLREATLRNSDTSLPRLAQYYYNALFSDEEEESLTIEDEREWEASLSEWLAGRVSGFRESWQPEWMSDLPASPIQGLSKAAVNALPREIYGQKAKWEEGSEQSDCSVCLEQFQAGQTLLCLPCKHKFHPACLTPWLEHHEQCPYCRARIHSGGNGGGGSNKDGGGGLGQYDNEDNLLAWLEAFETGMARMRFNGNNSNNR